MATIRYYQKKFPDLPLKETTIRRLDNLYQFGLKGQEPECLGASGFKVLMKYMLLRQVNHCLLVTNLISKFNSI